MRPHPISWVMIALSSALSALAAEATPAEVDSPAQATPEGAELATPPGRSRFWRRIIAHEPTYVVGEVTPPSSREMNIKFQLSLAFQMVGDPDLEVAEGDTRATGLYGAYTQTSFWNVESESLPFIDSSYRPELFWHQSLRPGLWGSEGLAIEVGVSHESNGKDGDASRSTNHIGVRPIIRWDLNDDWWLQLSPRFHAHVGNLDDNPDIERYRGYSHLDATLGLRDGLLLSVRGRIGGDWDRGSIQADLSYPLDRLSGGWVHGFAYVQAFAGWSENLIAYDQRVEQPRILIGVAITR